MTTVMAGIAPPTSVTHQFQQTSRNVAVNTAAQRVVMKIMDIVEPILDWALSPLRHLVAWIYNKFNPPMPAKPMIISLSAPSVPDNLILYVP